MGKKEEEEDGDSDDEKKALARSLAVIFADDSNGFCSSF